MADMDNFVPPVKPKHILGGLLKILVVLVVVAALVVGGLWFLKHHKSSKPVAAPKATSTSSQANPSGIAIATKTTHYDSTNYALGVDYPTDWTVNDTAGSKLAITSPALQLQDSNKQTFAGQIVFTVQSRQTSLPLFAPGHAVAAMASQKLTYKSPTPNQRAQTYLTYVNYSGGSSTIDALYITGDNGYTVTQGIPEGDMTKDDPLVSISFLKCADTACKTPGTATSISAGDWQNSSLSKPLISLLQSLVIE